MFVVQGLGFRLETVQNMFSPSAHWRVRRECVESVKRVPAFGNSLTNAKMGSLSVLNIHSRS